MRFSTYVRFYPYSMLQMLIIPHSYLRSCQIPSHTLHRVPTFCKSAQRSRWRNRGIQKNLTRQTSLRVCISKVVVVQESAFLNNGLQQTRRNWWRISSLKRSRSNILLTPYRSQNQRRSRCVGTLFVQNRSVPTFWDLIFSRRLEDCKNLKMRCR